MAFDILNYREYILNILESFSMILGLFSGLILYWYVFNKPNQLIEQRSLPYSREKNDEKEIITVGVSVNPIAIFINKANTYKDILYRKRTKYGIQLLLFSVIFGFIKIWFDYLNIYIVMFIFFVSIICLLYRGFLFFCYFEDVPTQSNAKNIAITPKIVEGGVLFETSEDYQKWCKLIQDSYTKILKYE